ncbi:MAG: purine-nucleoside phosphorylase [Acidobacteria bacterium]|nr:purine-nucleoside phosphorylase [Acidobacteriota bacterium]
MTDEYARVQEAAAFVGARVPTVPEMAIVLGSGLGDFAAHVADAVVLPYETIPGWPRPTVVGHAGKLVVGQVRGRRVAVLSGRAHFYEGHPMANVVFATRVVAMLGVKAILLTNAAGGINTAFPQGVLMVIDDHLNLIGTNPLIGPNEDRFGPRFPDMTEVYSKRLRAVADRAAAKNGLAIAHGIYAGLHGPSYETPAEIRYLRAIGADAVGMSTVPEAIVARHMGMEVLGISCITNMAAGVFDQPLNHSEVMETAQRVRGAFIALLEEIVENA